MIFKYALLSGGLDHQTLIRLLVKEQADLGLFFHCLNNWDRALKLKHYL